ncbi:MAG: glycolate oxidase subunit GlcF [Pseudomonadota bacterium]
MRTDFTSDALADPACAASESVIRKCVHCGFCLATCPTYVLLGDERDSPRGRIYMIKDMLEKQQAPSAETVRHIDRCLSCLSCMTTCPSDVNYMHLIDNGRAYVAKHFRRPVKDRAIRSLLAAILPHRNRFKLALLAGRLARPLLLLFRRVDLFAPFVAMLQLLPRVEAKHVVSDWVPAGGHRRKILLFQGCAEPVLKPEYQRAAERLLDRLGIGVIRADGEGCCGALVHHMGLEAEAIVAAKRNIDRWWRVVENEAVEAIAVSASGCGTTLKNYAFLLRNDVDYAERAATLATMVKDISEIILGEALPARPANGVVVAYHAACSLQHGQGIVAPPADLLRRAGFTVQTPVDAHLCCGSAGTYNILQPDIARRLAQRKADSLIELRPDVIATGNIGCAVQIAAELSIPVVHTMELLDWTYGGPTPPALAEQFEDRLQIDKPMVPAFW